MKNYTSEIANMNTAYMLCMGMCMCYGLAFQKVCMI